MSNNTRTRPFIAILACAGSFLLNSSLHAAPAPSAPESKASAAFPAEGKFCLSCHQGIEPTRPLSSGMMSEILAKGKALGDPNGCVVCHAGTPAETANKEVAHSGAPNGNKLAAFTPTPGALQINQNTCGQCHADHAYSVPRSLMNSDAGKMKAITWSWGIGTENHDHIYANHDLDDPDGATPRFGTETFKAYMKELATKFPGQYPGQLKKIPEVDLAKIKEMPEQAAFTYLRNCNACHLSGKGNQDRGRFRGVGCAACHTLYSSEGFYEGGDKSIPKDKAGHLMVHSMQGTRNSEIEVNGAKLTGVQVSTCAACHTGGRRIGYAYQGLMAYGHEDHRGPFDEKGGSQKPHGAYVYKHMKDDAHHSLKDVKGVQSGMLCQDCHSTTSMHGTGNIGTTALATIETECADCHGTPTKFPWELPLGYGEEFGRKLDMSKARGVADKPLLHTAKSSNPYAKEDGYLLTARGNPFGNVVRKGNKVIVHSANGHDFELTPLKEIASQNKWTNPVQAKTAMVGVEKHMEKLECYACHQTWAAQYYGYQYAVDYTKQSTDWLDSAEKVAKDGTTADRDKKFVMQKSAPTSWDYSHERWESPPLGVNGEGRVTPLVGVIQTVGTVIGPDGTTILWNNVFKTKAGHAAIELAPLNQHSTSKDARDCVDCHGNTAAAGYGIDGGKYDASPGVPKYADIRTGDGKNVSKFTQIQLNAIKGLHGDFMQAVTPDGKQVQTVDTHWPLSGPLSKTQRDVMARRNTCIGCHQDIPNIAPIKILQPVASLLNMSFLSEKDHTDLLNQNHVVYSWIKALGVICLVISLPILLILYAQRKRISAALQRMMKG